MRAFQNMRRGAVMSALVMAMGLSACDVSEQARRTIEDGTRLTGEQLAAQKAAQRGEVLRVDQPWYGGAVEVQRGSRQGDPLPKALEGARGVSLKLPGQADIRAIAAAITTASDLPVNIRTRYILPGGDVVEVPIGTRMRIDYQGPLSRLLDQIAARMDVAWHHEKGSLTIDRMVSRDYRVSLPIGTTEITDTAEIQRGPSIATTRSLDPWSELQDRLAPLAPPPARVTLSKASGRVTVFGPPSVQAAARKVIEDTQATASARIGLEVAVYFVDTDKAEEFGVGLISDTRIGRAQGRNVLATLTAATTGLTEGGGVIGLGRGNDRIDFSALARDRAVVDYRLASSIGQSGVISPINLTRTENYVTKTSVTTTENSSEVEIETDQLETGLSIAALPRLTEDRRIHLALTLIQRDRVGLTRFDAGTSSVQLPTVDNRAIRNETVLAPGEVLILSGYEQDASTSGARGLGPFKRIGLGGKREAQVRKVRMVVLVRPSLIPQERGRS